MSDAADILRTRLAFYRQVKICAAFLRERLDQQPYLPGCRHRPRPDHAQMRLPGMRARAASVVPSRATTEEHT